MTMKTIEDTTRETAREMGYGDEDTPRTEESDNNSISVSMTDANANANGETSLSDMAQNSVNEIKSMLDNVYSSDFVSSTWSQVRSMAAGGSQEKNARESTEEIEPADPEELRRIETLEKEKIVQFLQERHRSNAGHSGRRQ
ncbi:hypothetical protein BO70DRAFT_360913 [Aspergillus heteromorphus CBS 117.55]|uniref:Uncharacterized protein n=1 Tax=Aspergillus heteromorphus CBS 117.55 TaxID=1448321 RepID=A0A317WLA7_9EURO|nr:uncharacterized protein BO70DRAFT_360913 [Aspergillus heteromorphus CBS 117.55]PWY86102.1 hypothetical protein BO70DRAFT_360913 [Aspergillus heteromorphus CBS 117.55]